MTPRPQEPASRATALSALRTRIRAVSAAPLSEPVQILLNVLTEK